MISVIVPVYNTSEYLSRCVSSLVGQTYTDIEILLIDDGSTDQSGALCDEWAQKDNRIRVIHKENGGLISSWKRGVVESKGEVLNFIDSDYWVDTNMFEEMMAYHQNGCSGEIISSDYIIERMEKDGSLSQEYVYQPITPGVYDRTSIEENVIPHLLGNEHRFVTISRCMKLISRELILNNMDYSEESLKMGEDLSIILASLYDTQRLVIMDHKAYYHYLLLTDSMAHKYDSKMYDDLLHLRNVCQKEIEDKFKNNPSALKAQLRNLDKEFVHFLLLCVKNEARGNAAGYRGNILRLHSLQEELIKNCPISVSDTSNKLLYWTLNKPTWFRLSMLRLAMIIYYR